MNIDVFKGFSSVVPDWRNSVVRASPLAHAGFCEFRKQYLCISVSICGFVFQNFTTGDTENTEIIQIEKIFTSN